MAGFGWMQNYQIVYLLELVHIFGNGEATMTILMQKVHWL
jgi:hypothetical protein